MDVRAQLSMQFNIDKCMGCHTCSVACKNVWTSRKGAEYMWWNNIETKPGVGFPVAWEDQERYKGGWELYHGELRLKQLKGPGKLRTLLNVYYQPNLPSIDDYYEPWTYDYQNLFDAPAGDDQPTARAVSLITGEYLDKIKLGPNWDDDLAGSPVYASADPNLRTMSKEEKDALGDFQRLFHFYVPRICNHCLNPACVAACPSGAIYKRGEDGVVLIDQDTCRGWRFCVSACPYKKSYYNWETGKSEKCIFCYPRLEAGQVNACAHACTGRIRTVGVLLYDAERITDALSVSDEELVESIRDVLLDPFDPEVIAGARANGLEDNWIQAAQESPAYRLVKKWRLALPLHAEFRTGPMMFYVPPLSPILLAKRAGANGDGQVYVPEGTDFFNELDNMRVPVAYLSSLLSAGNTEVVLEALKKLAAIRVFERERRTGDKHGKAADEMLAAVGLTAEDATEIYKLISLATFDERFVIPSTHRETKSSIPMDEMYEKRGTVGFGSEKKGLLRREW